MKTVIVTDQEDNAILCNFLECAYSVNFELVTLLSLQADFNVFTDGLWIASSFRSTLHFSQ